MAAARRHDRRAAVRSRLAAAAGHVAGCGAQRLQRPSADVERQLASAEGKLRAARARRGLPRDTKVLAAWNGLALAAFAAGAQATNEPRYRQAAQSVRDVLATKLWDGRQLRRSPAGGRAALEDYAYVAQGLSAWAELTGDRRDHEQAAAIARAGWQRFYGASGWRSSARTRC
ncbi:MAG: hypothetical protein MZV65_29565 [Chromatiales bacterium]|nr:hypothetical protein [Chromatiales bacterium]